MKFEKTTIGFWTLLVVFGLVYLCLPNNVSAQADRNQNAGRQEKEDDDKDADEKLTRKDKQSVKIKLDEARAIALKRVPGTVVEEELEKEKGRLQYAFDIKDSNGKIWDVEVDAISGDVLYAGEDDEETDGEQGVVTKAGISVYRAANSVRKAAARGIDKIL